MDSHGRRHALLKRLARLKGEPTIEAMVAAIGGAEAKGCPVCAADALRCTELDLCVLMALFPEAADLRQFLEQVDPDDLLAGHGLAALTAVLHFYQDVAMLSGAQSYALPAVILLVEAYREAIMRIEAGIEELDEGSEDDDEDDDDDEEDGDAEDGHQIPVGLVEKAMRKPRIIAKGARVLLAIEPPSALIGFLSEFADMSPHGISRGIRQLSALAQSFFATANDIGQHLPDFIRDATGASDVAGPAEVMAQKMEEFVEGLNEHRDQVDPIKVMIDYLEFAAELGFLDASDTLNDFIEMRGIAGIA